MPIRPAHRPGLILQRHKMKASGRGWGLVDHPRLGQPRVMALLNALTTFGHIPHGFTNQSLRQQVADLPDPDQVPYRAAQMSYDLPDCGLGVSFGGCLILTATNSPPVVAK